MLKNEQVLLMWDIKIIFNFQNHRKSRVALSGKTASKNELM